MDPNSTILEQPSLRFRGDEQTDKRPRDQLLFDMSATWATLPIPA